MFRCLALNQGAHRKGLEKKAKLLKKQLENQTGLCFDKGVCISHIPDIERIFEVSVHVHSLQSDGHADVIYLSRLHYPSMHLNLHENHFSYITKFESFAKRFKCLECDVTFNRTNDLKRHIKTCCTEQKEIFVGGKYKRDRALFQRLEQAGYHTENDDQYCPLISTFDFEALQVKRGEKIKGRDILYKHIPATFSVHSNIPAHTEVEHRQSNGNPQKLVDELIAILHLHQETASQIMLQKHRNVLDSLERDIVELTENLETMGTEKEKVRDNNKLKKLQTLKNSLEKY